MRLTLTALFLALNIPAQVSAPVFEAATIKLNRDPNAGNGYFPEPGRLRVTGATLEQMIHVAFHVQTGKLFGTSGWMQSDRFDVEGKAGTNSNFEQELVMLQSLLSDRFQLRFHQETRQLRQQVLVLAKGGPKFQASQDQNAREQVNIRPTGISGTAIPFGHFVSSLEAQLKYPLTNETGLSGKFDLSLKYVRDDTAGGTDGPSVFAALEDQLGLKLDTRRGPAEVFVVDSAAKPADN
jgi:uncharacterized protein (TIGR03435 family)